MGKLSDKLKKKQDQAAEADGLDILTEVKEPFSFKGFFEEHVAGRARAFKETLQDKGVLFFLFSPFQARNRIIAELLVLCIGILFGVVPRASSMVADLQDQAYASEIAGLSRKTVGRMSITPAASSNYKKVHLLAFVLEGKDGTGMDLPSDASKYDVHLARSYGSSDWASVTYSWDVFPVTDGRRILLVAVDQSKQASGYGAFSLYVQVSGEEISGYAKTPFEVTLSAAQDTGPLYDKKGVHLSALTEAVCGTGDIAGKQKELDEALAKYQVALEKAERMPLDLTAAPTKDELETYCLANRIYRALDDTSTTEDILRIAAVDARPELEYGVVLTVDGIPYDTAEIEKLKKLDSRFPEDDLLISAFEDVDSGRKAVIGAMDSVNASAMAWYNKLSSYRLILNQDVDIDLFPCRAKCTNTIEEDIAWITGDGQPESMKPLESAEPVDESTEPVSDSTDVPDGSEQASDSTEPDFEGTEPAPETTEPAAGDTEPALRDDGIYVPQPGGGQ